MDRLLPPERLVLAALAAAWIVPAWWLGASTVAGQTFAALAGAGALLATVRVRRAPAGAATGERPTSTPFVVFCLTGFLALLLCQALNPDRILIPDGRLVGRLEPLPHRVWLPTGIAAPFDRAPGGLLLFANAWRHLLVAAGVVLPLAALARLPRRPPVVRALLGLLFAHGVVFSLFAFAHNLSGSTAVLWLVSDANFHLGAPQFPFKNQQGAYQLLLLAVGCSLWFLPAELRPWPALRRRRLWFALGTVAIFLGTVSTRSRFTLAAALLLVAGAGLLSLWTQRERWRRLPRYALALALPATALLLVLPPVRTTLVRFGELARDPGALLAGGSFRQILHRIALEMAQDRPWFGHGAGAYLPLFPLYQARVPAYMAAITRDHPTTNRPAHTHADGDWLEFAAEYGLVGTALFAAPWCVWLNTLRRTRTRTLAALLLAAGPLVVLVHGWIDFVLRNGAILALAAAMALLALAVARFSPTPSRLPPPPEVAAQRRRGAPHHRHLTA